jgi:hypothetical protein
MSFFSAVKSWAQVYILEKTDKVIAGVGGIANRQADALTQRSEFLLSLEAGSFISASSDGVVQVPDIVKNCILAGSGSISVDFPANPIDGQTLKVICASNDYTQINLTADGEITNAYFLCDYGFSANFVYLAASNTWYRYTTAPVASVAGRTGAVTLTTADLTNWSAATAGFLTSAPVTSVAGRTGAVTLTTADLTNWATATAGFANTITSVAGRTGAVTLTTADLTNWATATASMAKENIQVVCSDLTTSISVATSVAVFRMPYGMTVTDIRASLSTASTSGIVTIDVKKSGVSVLSTKVTIDATERTSKTAAAPAVISSATFADDVEVTIDINTAGTGAKGLVVTLIGVAA